MFAKRTNWNLAPNRLSEALAAHRAAGKPLLDLTVSNPTQCGFQYDGPAILESLSNPTALVYEPNPKGLESARRAVAGYYAARRDDVSVEDILLTTSTSEAYSYVFRTLCNPGDELLIPQPGYPLLDFLADIQDVRLVRYPLVYFTGDREAVNFMGDPDPVGVNDHGWRIDFRSLEQAITPRTRGVVVVHPNNPAGNFAKAPEMAKLNDICSAREIAIIADEVFLDFSLEENPRASFATNAGALTFTMSGLSKNCGLPQMKAAWLVVSGPPHWKREALARLEVIADTYLSLNTPVQLAIPVLLEQRHAFQKQLMSRVRRNLTELDRQMAGQNVCTRLAVEGGWYAVLRVPATRPDEDLAMDLLSKKGLYLHPGHFYDFPSDGNLIVSLITKEAIFSQAITELLESLT